MDGPAFEQLTHRRQLRRLSRLARAALGRYGMQGARIVPLLHGHNAVFRVEAGAGSRGASSGCRERYVLRVHGEARADEAQIRSELLWLQALRRDTALAVPEPVYSREGELVTRVEAPGVPEPRSCVLFRWVEGRLLYNVEPSLARLRQIGAFIAHLHRHAEQFVLPPGFVRDRQEASRLLGRWIAAQDQGHQTQETQETWDGSPSPLAREDEALLRSAAARLRPILEALRPTPETFGLIHADLHPANLLVRRGDVRAIDFDNCEFGYYVYDLAVFLDHPGQTQWPDQARKRAAVLEGYRRVRPLSEHQEAYLPLFEATRRLQGVPWLARMTTHPNHGAWARSVLPQTLRALAAVASGSIETTLATV
jgi:Ser/Thr protein kinase RdoA (MazF antagonist)